MKARHRNRAIVGLSLWLVWIAGLVVLHFLQRRTEDGSEPFFKDETALALALTGLAGQFASYVWGCYHLAKAKGQSSALLLLGLCPPFQLAVLGMLLVLPDRLAPHRHRSRSEAPPVPHESTVARHVRYRRNAVLWISPGLLLIAVALFLVWFDLGLVENLDNQTAVAIFVFIGGYLTVMTGAWWWVKAKGWNDAVVFIGMMPLMVLLVPFVRIILLPLLPAAMVMAPLILLVIILVLPDKSGLSRRKRKGSW